MILSRRLLRLSILRVRRTLERLGLHLRARAGAGCGLESDHCVCGVVGAERLVARGPRHPRDRLRRSVPRPRRGAAISVNAGWRSLADCWVSSGDCSSRVRTELPMGRSACLFRRAEAKGPALSHVRSSGESSDPWASTYTRRDADATRGASRDSRAQLEAGTTPATQLDGRPRRAGLSKSGGPE